ncbi:LOW QUALITY PROTEIN: solute carrier family 22 member 2-like [Pterocles gutturalis]
MPTLDDKWDSHEDDFSSRCRRYEVDWNTMGISCTDPLSSLTGNQSTVPLGPCQDSWVYDFPGTSLVTELNLVCEGYWKLDLFQPCVNAGFFIGSMSISYTADRSGRKLCLLVTVLVNGVSGLLMAFAPSYNWSVIFHLMQGLVNGGWRTGYVFIAEFVGSNYWRTAAITYRLAFTLGLLILTALAYALPHWRLQLTITLPNFFFLLYYWCLPQSPGWLIAQKQNNKAMEVIKHIAKRNKKKLISFQNLSSQDGEELKPSFLYLVRILQIRKHMFILMYRWFTSSVPYQGLNMHMGIASGNKYLYFLYSALIEFPAAFILMLTLDRIGHHYPWAAANIMAGGACLIAVLVPDTLYWLKMTAACLGRMGITMYYEMICLVNPELYPTFLRTLGVLVCPSMCDLGGIITPFLVYRQAELWHELPVIFAVIAFINGSLVLLLPEMKGKTLPKTIEDAKNLHRQEKRKEKMIYLHVLTSEAAPK